jgi:hypothetical protein
MEGDRYSPRQRALAWAVGEVWGKIGFGKDDLEIPKDVGPYGGDYFLPLSEVRQFWEARLHELGHHMVLPRPEGADWKERRRIDVSNAVSALAENAQYWDRGEAMDENEVGAIAFEVLVSRLAGWGIPPKVVVGSAVHCGNLCYMERRVANRGVTREMRNEDLRAKAREVAREILRVALSAPVLSGGNAGSRKAKADLERKLAAL